MTSLELASYVGLSGEHATISNGLDMTKCRRSISPLCLLVSPTATSGSQGTGVAASVAANRSVVTIGGWVVFNCMRASGIWQMMLGH
jgi:hypothetical protein